MKGKICLVTGATDGIGKVTAHERPFGIMYSKLERDNQHKLLREMIERVIVELVGNVRLELRRPFSYLQDISEKLTAKENKS